MTEQTNNPPVHESILNSIKQMLGGILETDHSFDTDIVIYINTVISILRQIGMGDDQFYITGATETWDDYLNDDKDLEPVKTYIYLKVKMIFDPPTSSIVADATDRLIRELEFRLNITTDVNADES